MVKTLSWVYKSLILLSNDQPQDKNSRFYVRKLLSIDNDWSSNYNNEYVTQNLIVWLLFSHIVIYSLG